MSTEEKRLVRGEPVVAKVLEAAMEEVARSGYEGLTLERVAARAGVNRTTIFRRWPTKKDLVIAMMERMTANIQLDFDHGSLREDLAAMISVATRTMLAPGMLGMHRVLMEARQDPDLRDLAECVRDGREARAQAILTRAEARGEFRKDLDKRLFLDGLMGALFAHIVFKSRPVTPEFTSKLLEYLLKVATPMKVSAAPRTRPKASVAAPRSKRVVRSRAKPSRRG